MPDWLAADPQLPHRDLVLYRALADTVWRRGVIFHPAHAIGLCLCTKFYRAYREALAIRRRARDPRARRHADRYVQLTRQHVREYVADYGLIAAARIAIGPVGLAGEDLELKQIFTPAPRRRPTNPRKEK